LSGAIAFFQLAVQTLK